MNVSWTDGDRREIKRGRERNGRERRDGVEKRTCTGGSVQGASAKTWRYIKMLVEQSQNFGKWSSLLILLLQLSLDQIKVKY